VNHTPFDLERHIDAAIERIANDRLATQGRPAGSASSTVANRLRQRLGNALIEIGERVGGPTVRSPKPTTPMPTHTPLLGF
jgi:hypothetical protein